MSTELLTARRVESLKPTPGTRLELFDTLIAGLALRVTPTGHKSWSVHYRTAEHRLRRLTLGSYPTVSLADARSAAQNALRDASHGDDPATAKTATRLGETVAELAEEFIEKYAKKTKRSWKEDQRMLKADVLPIWGTRKVKDLTRREIRELIERIAERAPVGANRYISLLSKMLNFAVQREWIDANPAALIKKSDEQSRERVLTDEEIRWVWAACADEDPPMCALLRLRLVTAQRGGELVKLRWKEDVDLETAWITIPASVSKNKLAHRVPLSKAALDILAVLPRETDWLFPGKAAKDGSIRPRTDATRGGTRTAARVLLQLQQTDPTITAFDFHAHDLRRTAGTRMAKAGISQADIAHVLNHVEGGPRATQVYNRYQYDREKRIALDKWARVLKAILDNKSAAVLPFAKGAV